MTGQMIVSMIQIRQDPVHIPKDILIEEGSIFEWIIVMRKVLIYSILRMSTCRRRCHRVD